MNGFAEKTKQVNKESAIAGIKRNREIGSFFLCKEKEIEQMENGKVRATRHNGRKGANGVFKAGHNDRSFNLDNAEHIDEDRSKLNVYWDVYQGYNLADENGVRPARKFLFEQVEYLYYHEHFGDSIDAQNERHEKSRHRERIRDRKSVV